LLISQEVAKARLTNSVVASQKLTFALHSSTTRPSSTGAMKEDVSICQAAARLAAKPAAVPGRTILSLLVLTQQQPRPSL